MDHFKTIPVGTLLEGQEPIVLFHLDSVHTALRKLSQHHIRSAPVVDEEEFEKGNAKIYGFLDVISLTDYLLQVLSSEFANSSSLSEQDLQTIAQRSQDFNLTSVMEVMEKEKNSTPTFASKITGFKTLSSDAPLSEAVQLFGNGAHSIVITEKQRLIGVLTQSALIEFIAKDPRCVGIKGDIEVIHSGLMQKPVIYVDPQIKTLDAFKIMKEKAISCLAIEIEGVLFGCLSASDVTGISDFRFKKLLEPVSSFLKEIRQTQGRSADWVFSCSPTTELKSVIKMLHQEKVHRIFVMDNARRPIGVVTLTDIIRELYL